MKKRKFDTIIVPAQSKTFEQRFVTEWSSIRISKSNLKQIEYIAVYQTAPISAITVLLFTLNVSEM